MLAIPRTYLSFPLSNPEPRPTEFSLLLGGVLLEHALTTARFTFIQLCTMLQPSLCLQSLYCHKLTALSMSPTLEGATRMSQNF